MTIAEMAPEVTPDALAEPTAPETEKVNLEAVFKSLTGFDEIAIAQRFQMEIQSLRERPSMACRAVLFIDARRKGATDNEAYKRVMEMPLSEVMDIVEVPDDDEDDSDPLG